MLNKITLLVLLSVFSKFSFSGEWSNPGEILGVYVDLRGSSERILIRHGASFVNPSNACRQDQEYYELKSNAAYSKEAYSLLLSAEAMKKKVRVYLEGCGSTDWPLMVLVDSIQ